MLRRYILICLVAVSAGLLLSSCGSSMQICNSKKLDDNALKSSNGYVDADTQLKYDFANNDTMLVISIETLSRPMQMRIIRNGIRFYLSPDGSKNLTRYVQYPVPNFEPGKFEDFRGMNRESGGPDMEAIIKNIDKKVRVVVAGYEQSYYLDIDKISYNFKLEANNEGRLKYMAYINLKNITKNMKDTTTVIGIELPKPEIPKRQERAEESARPDGGGFGGSGMPGTPGGMTGGGMPGGGRGGRGGMGGGGRGGHGDGQSSERRQGGTEEIKLWINLKLK